MVGDDSYAVEASSATSIGSHASQTVDGHVSSLVGGTALNKSATSDIGDDLLSALSNGYDTSDDSTHPIQSTFSLQTPSSNSFLVRSGSVLLPTLSSSVLVDESTELATSYATSEVVDKSTSEGESKAEMYDLQGGIAIGSMSLNYDSTRNSNSNNNNKNNNYREHVTPSGSDSSDSSDSESNDFDVNNDMPYATVVILVSIQINS